MILLGRNHFKDYPCMNLVFEFSCAIKMHERVLNERVGLKLRMLRWVEIKIELGYDLFKFTLGSIGLS